jgi:hypothetical protein
MSEIMMFDDHVVRLGPGGSWSMFMPATIGEAPEPYLAKVTFVSVLLAPAMKRRPREEKSCPACRR